MNSFRLLAALAVTVAVAVGSTLAWAGTGDGLVSVPKRQPVEIAVVLDTEEPLASLFTAGIRNAINMAVAENPTVRGFPIQVNESSGPCFGRDAVALNAAAAQAVVANPQNVAVIGHICSFAMANTVFPFDGDCAPLTNDGALSALSIYETRGLVTINGSTTNPCLPLVGPTVFNGTYVPDTEDPLWYDKVQAVANNVAWRTAYATRFGVPASDFADTYYDATKLLLDRLSKASKIKNGNLVIDRATLAAAVRSTTNFCGATGKLSLDSGGFRIDSPHSC